MDLNRYAPLVDLISGRDFERFQNDLKQCFASYGLEYALTYCIPTDNPAMRLDFDSPKHIGRVTVWESGACDLEVIDIDTKEYALLEHHDLSNELEFHDVYSKVATFMRDALAK